MTDQPPIAPGALEQRLLAGEFALTTEIVPPVSARARDILIKAEAFKGHVDAVNVTDGASAKVHMSSLASAALLQSIGVEPIMQMTCRDRNRIALLSDLLGAGALGIRNFLFMRGDNPDAGPYPQAKPVFDVDSLDLIQWAHTIGRDGKLPDTKAKAGQEIGVAPGFFVGAADSPIDPPADWEPIGLMKKIEAGAQFSQTQLCYDIDIVRRYIARLTELGVTEKVHILIGTGPLASARQARWMTDNLWGVEVPAAIITRLDGARDPRAEGIKICVEFLEALTAIPGVAGAHLMAPGNGGAVPEVINAVHLNRS